MRHFFYGVFLLSILTFQACGGNDEDSTLDPDKTQTGGQGSAENENVKEWNEYAERSTDALLTNYWNSSENVFRFWHLTAGFGDEWANYWPQAHSMDVVIDAFIRAKNSNDTKAVAKYGRYFSKWYTGIYKKNGNRYENNYYDDMEWICLTMIRLSEVSGDRERYMNTAKQIWEAIKTGWTDDLGGGILWRGYDVSNERTSKNACSNGPAGIIAARLYQLNGDEEYLEWAKKIYDWQKKKLVTSAGRVNDNMDLSGKVTDWNFTYNQGTHLGMAHELYKITGEKSYMEEAIRTAEYTVNNLIDSNRLLKPEGTRDGGLFKGIFIRYFVKLLLDENLETVAGKPTKNMFVNFFTRNSDTLWSAVKDNQDIVYDQSWSKAGDKNDRDKSNDVMTQVSASTLIEARAFYEYEIAKE